MAPGVPHAHGGEAPIRALWVPFPQLTVLNAWAGSAMANVLTLGGCGRAVRRGTTGGRPMPQQGLGGSGRVPGGPTTTAEVSPTAYDRLVSPSA